MFKLLVELIIEVAKASISIPYNKFQTWYVIHRVNKAQKEVYKLKQQLNK